MIQKHHVLHARRHWNSTEEAQYLRRIPQLIPPIEQEWHSELHKNCPAVPLLGYHTLKRVAADFLPQRMPLDSIADLLIAIDTASRHHKVHPIERELAGLAIEAIELQIPYIEQGILK